MLKLLNKTFLGQTRLFQVILKNWLEFRIKEGGQNDTKRTGN